MSHNQHFNWPSNLFNWKNVVSCINGLLKDYEKNVKTVSDIINGLREIKHTFDGSRNYLYSDDVFVGLGVFLEKLKTNELRIFVDISFRNILYYAQMVEQVGILENELLFKNDVAKVSLFSGKCILACSILCVMPYHNITISNETQQERLDVNLQQLYCGIIHGSKMHTKLLKSILNFYLEDPLQVIANEKLSFLTITAANCDTSPFTTRETLQSWPIVLVSKSVLTNAPLPNTINLWPMYFPRILPYNLLSCSDLSSELPIYSHIPVLIPLLPLLTRSISENIGAINVKWRHFSCSIQKVHFLNNWNRQCQFSKDSIVENIAHCLLALKSSQKDYGLYDTNFATDFTQSIIEDVIEKLNSKSSPLTYENCSKQGRSSLTSNVLRGSREGSISSTYVARSARHSYSNSSLSRSGSLQLSSLSSRRSSSNTSSSMNKDQENGNLSSDKVDYSVHTFQPIIVEESANHVEEEEVPLRLMTVGEETDTESGYQWTPLDEFMSGSISDSKKMSLSKDINQNVKEQCVTSTGGMKRRNSSPLLKPVFEIGEIEANQTCMIFEENELFNRCCEEDANNDHLIRLNNRSRRQSLPCHLYWLYQLPLTDSVKINLSVSQSFTDHRDISSITMKQYESSFDDNVERRIIIDSKKMLAKLVTFADGILNNICLNSENNGAQQSLRMEILNKRHWWDKIDWDDYRDSSVTGEDQMSLLWDDHSLVSRDLATFDRVLNSSTFFDNEALQLFSKLSTMSSTSSVWTPHDGISLDDTDTVITRVTTRGHCETHDHRKSNSSTIVDYVNQLTNSIISAAMDHNFTGVRDGNATKRWESCDECVANLAERISVEIVSTAFMELVTKNNKTFKTAQSAPIYVGSFPIEYDRQLSMLMQMLAGAISQRQTGRNHVMIFDQVTIEMEEIFLLLATESQKCNPEKVLRAIMALLKESETVSMSNLISYLMHN